MPPDSRKEQGKHPTRWTKGTSGNPSGRPGKGAEIRRQLMDLTPDAMRSITEGIKAGDTACLKIWAELFASIKDANTHIANLRRQINGTHD